MFLLNPFVFSQSGGYVLDPAKVKLLLHFDGNFNDSSPNNHAMSGGNISIDTTDTKFGSGKLRFGDSPRNGYLMTTNNVFNFGENQPFTLCFWAKDGDGNGGYADAIPFILSKGAVFLFRNEPPLYDKSGYENWIFVPFSVTDLNNWVHIAVVADGSRIKGYLNGVQQFNIAHPSWPSMMSFLQFGQNGDGQYSNGTLDEVLLYSDALWTADFTPPTAPFTY